MKKKESNRLTKSNSTRMTRNKSDLMKKEPLTAEFETFEINEHKYLLIAAIFFKILFK